MRARAWFGEALTPWCQAAQHHRQVELLLSLAAAHDQGGSGMVEGGAEDALPGRFRAHELLVPDHLLKRGEPTSAVFRLPVDASPSAGELSVLPSHVVFA